MKPSVTFDAVSPNGIKLSGSARNVETKLFAWDKDELDAREAVRAAEKALERAAEDVAAQQAFLSTQGDWLPEAKAQLTKAVARANGISSALLEDLGSGLKLLGTESLPKVD